MLEATIKVGDFTITSPVCFTEEERLFAKFAGYKHQKAIVFICQWVNRMAKKYDGVVCDREMYNKMDWGCALMRECFGIHWIKHPHYKAMEAVDGPTQKEADRAKRWEEGEWPKWAYTEKYDPYPDLPKYVGDNESDRLNDLARQEIWELL